MDERLPAMWLVPLKCRKKAMYSYVYSMCDFVFPCESSRQIRIKFNQETVAEECKESMVLMKQSGLNPCQIRTNTV